MALIIFDYDGVLADTLDDLILFGQEACNQVGINHLVTKGDLSNLEVMSSSKALAAMPLIGLITCEYVLMVRFMLELSTSPIQDQS